MMTRDWSSVSGCGRPMDQCGLWRTFVKQLHKEARYSIGHSVSRKIFSKKKSVSRKKRKGCCTLKKVGHSLRHERADPEPWSHLAMAKRRWRCVALISHALAASANGSASFSSPPAPAHPHLPTLVTAAALPASPASSESPAACATPWVAVVLSFYIGKDWIVGISYPNLER
jgi:hypothetical protein